MIHRSYNEFHLGDNLIHLHFLRKLASSNPHHDFVHAVHACHLAQLNEVVFDVPNLKLADLEQTPRDLWGRNVWKNAGATQTDGSESSAVSRYVPGFWEVHPLRNDYAGFYLAWFEHLAQWMSLRSPFEKPEDLLFDYPKLQENTVLSQPFDFLIVNSRPCSGQFRAYDDVEYLSPLIEELAARYSVVVSQPVARKVEGLRVIPCTMDHQLSISQIGNLSLYCKYLLMVSTGPSWPTFNIWNTETVKLRVLMLDHERVDYAPNTVQVRDAASARMALVERGLL